MTYKVPSILAALALALSATSAHATNVSVASIPDGMMTFALKHGSANYISLPLTATSIYTSTIASVTNNGIAVDDVPAPFTSNLANVASPYFVKILSGNEAGRVMLVTSNTGTTLTLDITDHGSGEAVALNTTNFDIQPGDVFEIFPGDTLSSVFGDGSANNPLVTTGGANVNQSDIVSLFNTTNSPATIYFFNTKLGYWVPRGGAYNANNTIIYPFSALSVTRRASHPDTSLILSGRVTQVNAATKVTNHASVFTSTHYATDIKLSQLSFGANWAKGDTIAKADTLSVWDASRGRFDIYFQKSDSTWRKSGDAKTDQSDFVIPAGTVTSIAKKAAVAGADAFLLSSMPYSLN